MAERKNGPVTTIAVTGKCLHDLDLVACEPCRSKHMAKVRSKAARPSYVDLASDVHDLDVLIRDAIPYVAARSVLDEADRGFWLDEVADEVLTVRRLAAFTRALYGSATPQFQAMARDHLLKRVRYNIRARDVETNVRLYVCWRIPGTRPRRWGALRYLQADQVRAVARDYGILGEGVAFSKDAALFLVDLMVAQGETARVSDIWDRAVPQLKQWRAAG